MTGAIIPEKLHNELMELVERGDEKAFREYLTEHLKEFPRSTQDAIVMAFLAEALGKQNNTAKRVADFQEEGLKMLKNLDEAQAQAEKQKQLLALKKDL